MVKYDTIQENIGKNEKTEERDLKPASAADSKDIGVPVWSSVCDELWYKNEKS